MLDIAKLRVLLIQLFVTLNVETISFRVYEAHDPKAEKYSRFYDVITLDDFNDVSIIMDSTTENELAVEAVVTFKHEMFKAYNICRTYMGCDSEHIIKEIIGLIADYQYKFFTFNWSKWYFGEINYIRANYLHKNIDDRELAERCDMYIESEKMYDEFMNCYNEADDHDDDWDDFER